MDSPSVRPADAAERLARSAGVVGLATMSSRALGVVREQVLAYLFGAGREMDAFNVAFRIPNLARDLFAEGAMSAAFVPTFTASLATGTPRAAWRMASSVLNLLILATLAVALAGILAAEPLVRLFAEGFAAVPGKLELTVRLTRVMFPFLTLVAVAAVLMGMLNALQRFFVPSFAPAMFNVGTIVSAIVLVPLMPSLGWPRIMGIAIGALIGGLLQAAVQWPAIRREGFEYTPSIDVGDAAVRRVFVLMGPGLIGIAGVQVNLLVNTVLATSQGEGAVSWLNYAFRLIYLPIGLFGVSIATAAVPPISRAAAAGDLAELRRTLSRGLRMMLVLNVPATVGLIVLASPIVSLLFEHGRFTRLDADATTAALICYAPGLIGYCAIKLAVPSLYSLRDSRTPAAVSLVAVACNIALSLALVRAAGYRGLAVATSAAALINGALLLASLRHRLGGIDGSRVLATTLKITAASAVMAIVTAAVAAIPVSGSMAAQMARVGGAIAAGLMTLALAARAFGVSELDDAADVVWRRLRPSEGGPTA